MKKLEMAEFMPGRRFIGRLPQGEDLIGSIERFCREASIRMACFTVIGAVTSATIGVYDHQQQVYVTFRETSPLDISTCVGNVSMKDGNPVVHAHSVFSDETGNIIGGHLFSDTIVFAAEIDFQELVGDPLERSYDTATGLMQWRMG